MLSVKKITLNYEDGLCGVDKFPIVGWKIESDKKNVKQVSYQLQLATDDGFNSIVLDSGVVTSDISNNITLSDDLLKPSTRYYLRVRMADNHNEHSAWSPIAEFVTGLMDEPWKAKFITAENHNDRNSSQGTYLRKAFDISSGKKVTSAFIHVSALGLYQLHVNGEKIGADELTPGWTSYHHHLLYQTYDLTNKLNDGINALGAIVGAGWFKGDMGFSRHRNYYGEHTAFIAQLVINYSDATQDIIITDETWKGSDSPIIFSEIYDGETYDARNEQRGWNKGLFDDATWKTVNQVSYDKRTLTAQGTCKVQKIEEIAPLALIITEEGDTVIDFGQNLSGWVEFSVSGKRGDSVILRHFEVLDSAGNVYLDNLRTAKQRIEYILKGEGTEVYRPHFTYQGFRYVKVEKFPQEIELDNFKAVVLHSNMEQTGHFSCSNKDINQLHHNILWGLKGNFVDVPTDCPQRDERLGWTGDAQIFCRTASYLMQTRNFFSKWLTDLKFDQTPEGGVPHVIPDILSNHCEKDRLLAQGGTHSASAWADAAIINPWTMYLMYGDKQVLEQQYESMKAWIDFMHVHSENNIWRYKIQFGDWVALDAKEGSYFGATPNDLTCTAYYAYSTMLFSKIAGILERSEDCQIYGRLHREIVDSFQKEFFTPTGRLAARTQTAHILSLYFNLVPEKYKPRTVDTLIDLLQEQDGHLVTGFVGTPYFCHALSQNGRAKEAWELLLKDDFPSWLYQVKAGATTIWEHWDGIKPDGSMWSSDMNSFNHYAYGAVGDWLYRAAAGIEADESHPGFKHVKIKPMVGGGLSFLDTVYQSIYGDIGVSWKLDDYREITGHAAEQWISLKVTVPHNSDATITLVDAMQIEADGIQFTQCNGGEQCALVGSGEYLLRYRIQS